MKVGYAIAAASMAVCVSVPPTANASQYYTVSFMSWGGADCIWVTSPSYGNYWATSTDYVCDSDHQIAVNTPALSGQWVGADPIIKQGITWAGCSVVINQRLDFADYADAGDGTDVNCLRILK